MIDDNYPEIGLARRISPGRLRRFIAHLGKATSGLKDKKRSESRKHFLSKIEELSGDHLDHHDTDNDFSSIETKLKRLEDIETSTIQVQKSDEAEIVRLKEGLQHEDQDIEVLRGKIQLLERRLADSELKRIRQLKESKEKMLAFTHMLSDINVKFSTMDKQKEKLKPAQESAEMNVIKRNLKSLEDVHKRLKKSKKHSKEDIARVESKIAELKGMIS